MWVIIVVDIILIEGFMLLDNEGLMLLEVGVLQFKNDTSNECMLNSKHAENNKK